MKKSVLFVLFMMVTGFLAAQTADEMDRLLDAEELTCSQAAEFVLRAADVLPEGADAFAAAGERGWLPAGEEAGRPVRLGELALLIMKAFNIKGGVMYSHFPIPRYACRTLVYNRIIRGRTDPGGHLDGRTFLQILDRALAYAGGDDITPERL